MASTSSEHRTHLDMILASRSCEHRTYLDIIASILDACRFGANKTRVMYRCNMNFRELTEYLDLLLKANLLLFENDDLPLFRVSGKGIYFLKAYGSLMAMME